MDRKLLYQERNQTLAAEETKREFLEFLEKAFKTTMIGSIYNIEQLFGHLWGFNSNEPMSAEQKEWYKLWQELRTIILNNGNAQKRAAEDRVKKLNLTPNRFQLKYVVQPQDEGK